MKIGIVVSTNEAEVCFNLFRFANWSLKSNHEVTVFLVNRGVELEDIADEKFDVKKHVDSFIENKGRMLACGTCLNLRQNEGSNVCQFSTTKDLLKLVEESDKLLTFG